MSAPQGAVPPEETLPIAKQIAEGLEYAHERGIGHRDLKPANVKIKPDGAVKLVDSGLAKALEGEAAASARYSLNQPVRDARKQHCVLSS